jgi:precorrin-6A synthase
MCERLIAEHLRPGEVDAFPMWGDPQPYDSSIVVVDDALVRDAVEFDVRVVAGVSSISALAPRRRTTCNRVAGAVQIATGRRLAASRPEEILIAGPLFEVADRVVEVGERGRAAKGWIMDSYLLRRLVGNTG